MAWKNAENNREKFGASGKRHRIFPDGNRILRTNAGNGACGPLYDEGALVLSRSFAAGGDVAADLELLVGQTLVESPAHLGLRRATLGGRWADRGQDGGRSTSTVWAESFRPGSAPISAPSARNCPVLARYRGAQDSSDRTSTQSFVGFPTASYKQLSGLSRSKIALLPPRC